MDSVPSDNSPVQTPPKKELLDNAIRFWEVRRIAYNVFLAAIVIGQMIAYRDNAAEWFVLTFFLSLFMLAVVANIAYCTAYIVDLPAQYSSYRNQWLRWRWVLWLVGMLFASSWVLMVSGSSMMVGGM